MNKIITVPKIPIIKSTIYYIVLISNANIICYFDLTKIFVLKIVKKILPLLTVFYDVRFKLYIVIKIYLYSSLIEPSDNSKQ